MPPRTYSQEEVDAILDRALRTQAKDGTRLTHEELVAAAGEAGIPKEAIDSAARDLDAKAPEAQGEPADAAIVATWKKRARRAFFRHLVAYLLVGAMLAFINFSSGAAFLWFPIAMLGWGIGLAMHLFSLVFADEERILTRERRHRARRARREKWRTRGAEFERAVDQGVRALLEMAEARGTKRDAPARASHARVDAPAEQVRVGEPLSDESDPADEAPEKARR